MKTQDFTYNLPDELIAQEPLADRSKSRLLTVNRETQEIADANFAQIIDFLKPNDLLNFNNTKVINARMFGKKETGGKLEVLVERVLCDKTVYAHVKSSKSPKPGAKLILEENVDITVLGRKEPVGRRLDFLMQELNREANTLSSKSSDAETTRAAVDMKVLIEQMREQVQNIE